MLVKKDTEFVLNFHEAEKSHVYYVAISCIHSCFWKSIDNCNRSTERKIGKPKGLIQAKIREKQAQLNRFNMRLRAYLCNMES